MADVVVVGAGLGGLAVAARLAKLRHRVTICERNRSAGGAIHPVARDGFRWDAGPTSTCLPAVIRDLFRKSGRPVERYLDLQFVHPARRHVFEDQTLVDLPMGSRAAQIDALDSGLGEGAGRAWAEYVDRQAGTWEVLRTRVLDGPDAGRCLSQRDVARALHAGKSLARLVRQSLRDERLRAMAAYPSALCGSAPRRVPALAAVDAFIEREFGVWGLAAGMATLTDALVSRLAERAVDLLLDTEVVAISGSPARASSAQASSVQASSAQAWTVTTAAGKEMRADHVVCDIDPISVFDILQHPADGDGRDAFRHATRADPPGVTHLGLVGQGASDLPAHVVLHGDPLLVLNTAGAAPEGHLAWTVWRRAVAPVEGAPVDDLLDILAERGLDVRDRVVARLDRSSADVVSETGGSPYGLAWAGWRTHVRRCALANPIPGLHLLGAGMHGPSIPFVAWGAANVADRIGEA